MSTSQGDNSASPGNEFEETPGRMQKRICMIRMLWAPIIYSGNLRSRLIPPESCSCTHLCRLQLKTKHMKTGICKGSQCPNFGALCREEVFGSTPCIGCVGLGFSAGVPGGGASRYARAPRRFGREDENAIIFCIYVLDSLTKHPTRLRRGFPAYPGPLLCTTALRFVPTG